MKTKTIALVGNPNCGKSTLFNALTKSSQKVGNWPGVTVECKIGQFRMESYSFDIVDLPGIYRFSISSCDQAIDEQIACNFILKQQADLIINVIDATHLERHLYLTLQLLAMDVPVIVAVNMMDVAVRRGIRIDLKALQEKLGCKVVGLVACKGNGIPDLKKTLPGMLTKNTSQSPYSYPESIRMAIASISAEICHYQPKYRFCADWLSQQLLQDSHLAETLLPQSLPMLAQEKKKLELEYKEEIDIIIADFLYTNAHQIVSDVTTLKIANTPLTEQLDKIILNRYLGIPIFLIMMYLMFLFAISFGGAFQDFFDISSNAIFVNGTAQVLQYCQAPNWLIALLAAGFGRGINTTVTFIPVIGCMFFFLAFMESCGYMARAIFVIDRFMRIMGLPGKSFVPLIIGFGCNVPAILAARNLEHKRDRILTILMSPFMSCGARLAIFAVFTSAFFPVGGQNIVFSLYCIGILAALLTGLILRKTVLKGDVNPLVFELPAYHLPTLKGLLFHTWHRLKSFIISAGKLIIPLCLLIGFLNSVNVDGSLNQKESSSNSLLSSVGRAVTPIFAPMGIQDNNWPATVGLLTGVLAKEVVVATLNTLYSQEAMDKLHGDNDRREIKVELKEALISIPSNLAALKDLFINPMGASAQGQTVNHQIYGIMHERFSGQVAAFAYLLFVLLYFPCVSATSVMAKELNKPWAFFSVGWSTVLAYGVATTFYQLATLNLHPMQSLLWVGAISICITAILFLMKRIGDIKNVCNYNSKVAL